MDSSFEERLKGGHPNSLGNTVEIVEEVLTNPVLFEQLFNCYLSEDEVVRLRVSNAMKRICKADKALLIPYIDRLIHEISRIDQASTQWTLASLFHDLKKEMTSDQKTQALEIMKHNLETHHDWIVLNTTMQTLSTWDQNDQMLRAFMIRCLKKIVQDERKSVHKKATTLLRNLEHN